MGFRTCEEGEIRQIRNQAVWTAYFEGIMDNSRLHIRYGDEVIQDRFRFGDSNEIVSACAKCSMLNDLQLICRSWLSETTCLWLTRNSLRDQRERPWLRPLAHEPFVVEIWFGFCTPTYIRYIYTLAVRKYPLATRNRPVVHTNYAGQSKMSCCVMSHRGTSVNRPKFRRLLNPALPCPRFCP